MNPTRRQWMTCAAAFGAAATAAAAAEERQAKEPFGYCLNTSTVRGQKLKLPDLVDLASKAGFQAIEPWIGEIEQYQKDGGNLKNLAKRIADRGLTVESAIGFAPWIVDDPAAREKGLEQAKRDMDLVKQLGGKRIAAPPAGATDRENMNLLAVAERYWALCELGEKLDVTPQVEVWGFSKALGRLGETAFVAIECRHARACVLPDVYHLYKGGSDFAGLRLLSGVGMQVFHVNDYPANPPRDKIGDKDRVYPGDGVAPLKEVLRTLRDVGFRGFLSLELFNRDYWQQDALQVMRTGLEKMKASVRNALG